MSLQVECKGSGLLFAELLEELAGIFSPALVDYLSREFSRVERLILTSFDGRLGMSHQLDFQFSEAYRLMHRIGSLEMKVRLERSGQNHERLKLLVFRYLQGRLRQVVAGRVVSAGSFLLDILPC